MWLYYGPHLNPSHSQQFRLNQRKRRHGLLLSSIWFFSSLDWQGGVLTWESQQPAFLTPKHHFYTPTSQEHVYGFSTSSTTNLPSLSSGPKYSRVTCRSYEIQRGGGAISLHPSPSYNARTELNCFRAFFSIGHESDSLVRLQVQTDTGDYILTERGS